MALIYCNGDNPLADSFAKDAAEVLVAAYPNHSWWVDCSRGLLVIKHLEASGFRGSIGMVRLMTALPQDAKSRGKEILRAAGELLERAGLRRGPRGDEPVKEMELDAHLRKFWHKPIHAKRFH